ncbi:HD domain-containing phosphohydrolase [Pirellulaceae bacterium SH449]
MSKITNLCEENARNACILVVDDEPFVRRLVSRWLNAAGHSCFLAASVEEATAILDAEFIDVITSDINMPGMSGVEWLPRLRATHPDIAVLMLTGCDDIQHAISTLTAGASGYLIKPVDRRELLFQVDRALERQRIIIADRNRSIELEEKVREQTLQIRQSHEETIERLIVASKLRDDETGEHIRRIGELSAIIAGKIGWSNAQVDMIRLAASMHDVGKVGISDAILKKPGKLTPEEYRIMQAHTKIGAKIMSGSNVPMLQMAEQIARWHHERWDGTGYPDGLVGEQIPIAARIVAIVDFYDAVSHDRVYRKAIPQPEVLKMLSDGRGTQFDPTLLDVFFDSLNDVQRILNNGTKKQSLLYNQEPLFESTVIVSSSCHPTNLTQLFNYN